MKWIPLFTLLLAGCTETSDLQTVPQVDLKKYMGTWYEIARLPNSFQRGCTHTTANYTLNNDNTVTVINKCLYKGNTDREKGSEGSAYVSDTTTNSKLKVTFFWPFYGSYWIIDLADDYSYAVVASPDKDYLWILNRSPQMSPKLYNKLIKSAAEKGFDVSKVVKTYHRETVSGKELEFIKEY